MGVQHVGSKLALAVLSVLWYRPGGSVTE
jgi:hypothetical protein